MMKSIYILLLALLGSLGVQAQTAQPNLPSGSERYSQTLWIAPDSTLWTGKSGNYTRVATNKDLRDLAAMGYTRAQVDSAITANTPVSITRSQALSLISNSGLKPGNRYVISDATASDISIVATATGTNVLSEKVDIVGDSFTWVDYDINADVVEAYDVIACAIRNISGVWQIIDDVDHTPKGVANVTQDNTNNWFNLFYTRTDYNEVVSMSYAVDEAYARNLYWVGASVGTTYSRFELYINQCYGFLRGDAGFVSNSANSKGINTTSWNSTTGTLTITTWPYTGLDVSAISGHPYFRCIITGVSGNNVTIQFVDSTGAVATTADNRMIVFFSRTGSRRVENINANEPNSNIWVNGVMKKRIE